MINFESTIQFMKRLTGFTLFSFLIISGCNTDSAPEVQNIDQKFYVNFKLDNEQYFVSDKDYKLSTEGLDKLCNDKFVSAEKTSVLEESSNSNPIRTLKFSLSKKVFWDQLKSEDQSSYTKQVLYANSYGFPIITTGFYEQYDLEQNNVVVSRENSTEAYLWIVTNDGKIFRSTSIVENERSKDSFLKIDKITENKEDTNGNLKYIVEGTFKVNLFEGMYGTESKMAQGTFRLPVAEIPAAEVFSCR